MSDATLSYRFITLEAPPAPPACGLPVQVLGLLCSVEPQRARAALEAPPPPRTALPPAAAASAAAAHPPPRLALDTSLLPAEDVHRAAAGLVHALGTLRLVAAEEEEEEGEEEGEGGSEGGGGMAEEGAPAGGRRPGAGAPQLVLLVDILRPAEGADYAALARALGARAAFLEEEGAY